MQTKLASTLTLTLTLGLTFAGCTGGEPASRATDPDGTVATGAAGAYTVRLLSTAPLQVGLNALAVEVTAGGAPIADAAVTLDLRLTTATGTEGCPVFGPGAAGSDGRYALEAVLPQPGGPATWSAEVALTRGGATTVVPLSALSVQAGKDLARTFASGGSRYVLALEFESAPKVGLNPVIVTVHESPDGVAWMPVSDATLTLDPQMPSMGHGSPGSEDPALVAPGRYRGRLSLSMSGEWVVTIAVARAGATVGAPQLTIRF